MFTLGFEKIAGPLGKAVNRAGKAAKYRAHEIKEFRKRLAADIVKRRNRLRKGKVKGSQLEFGAGDYGKPETKVFKSMYAGGEVRRKGKPIWGDVMHEYHNDRKSAVGRKAAYK